MPNDHASIGEATDGSLLAGAPLDELSSEGDDEADELPPAQVGEAWTAEIEAFAADTTRLYWQLLDAPAGMVNVTLPSVNVGTFTLAPSTASHGVIGTSRERSLPSRRK